MPKSAIAIKSLGKTNERLYEPYLHSWVFHSTSRGHAGGSSEVCAHRVFTTLSACHNPRSRLIEKAFRIIFL